MTMDTNHDRVTTPERANRLSELSQRALAFYREKLRGILEPAEYEKGIGISPDTGDYLVAETPTHASRAMRGLHPAGSYSIMRLGPSTDYALAARMIAGRAASGKRPSSVTLLDAALPLLGIMNRHANLFAAPGR